MTKSSQAWLLHTHLERWNFHCHAHDTDSVSHRPYADDRCHQAALPISPAAGRTTCGPEARAVPGGCCPGSPHPSCTAPSCLPERPRVPSAPPSPSPRRAVSTTRELACVGRKGSASLQAFPGIPESTCKSDHHTLFLGTVHGRLNKKGKFKTARRNDFFRALRASWEKCAIRRLNAPLKIELAIRSA